MTQRALAARMGAGRRTIQEWEAGAKYPSADGLRALIAALLEAGGLTAGRETAEAQGLWAAALREAPRMHTPFDQVWFAGLLASRAVPLPVLVGDVLQAGAAAAVSRAAADERGQDWGEAPDVLGFVGRAEELALLRRWLLVERCRLVAVLGFGGIGKTSLVARLAQSVTPSFTRVYWRSLRNAPPVGDWLVGAIGFLSDQQMLAPPSESERTNALLQLLRARRCLLVLDNSETLFAPGESEGRYRAGMEGYGRVLQSVGETSHQSCLLLTSREAPPELAVLGDAVRALELHGLGTTEAQTLLVHKHLHGETQTWVSLVDRYGGNGLALKIVGETIRQVFDGDIVAFLEDAVDTHGVVFGGIRRLLDVQAERLSEVEHDVLTRLAVEREPISLAELSRDMAPGVGRSTVVEAIENLRRRSLVEPGERGATFTLQSMVLEYVIDRLVETVADEIGRGQPVVLVEQPLIKAQAKDYVRQTQERLIGEPILEQLRASGGTEGAEQWLRALLEGWRARPDLEQGYGPGNVVNLLRLLRGNLRGLNLSHLSIRQAYLQDIDAQDASLVAVHLAESVLAGAFNHPMSIALSADGRYVAAGTSGGEVCLWNVADRTSLLVLQAHTGITRVALSGDGRLLASCSTDGSVKLWEAPAGRLVAALQGHTGPVWGLALSADGRLLASGSFDGTIRLWEAPSGRPLATLEGHVGQVYGVALSADGRLLATGGFDATARFWDIPHGQLLVTLEGHTGVVQAVALTGDGRLLASGSTDGTVKLWEAPAGRLLAALQGHTGPVWGLALSADGRLLASGGFDGTIRLWEVPSGRPLATLDGHAGPVQGVALSADGRLLASGGFDATARALGDARWADACKAPGSYRPGVWGGVEYGWGTPGQQLL